MLTTYEPSIFDGLNKFPVARQCLEKHKDALREAGAVICKHGLQQKVGLALLHKHFDLLPHERLIENIEDSKVYINPIIGVDDAAILPYLWKLNYTNVTQNSSWFPLEFQYKSAAQPDDIKAIESQG
ncbi:hypothetical protein [Nostoc sphaeroides]|uniref:Uncharacterized protein n=1 Tax=Nostoc sphaeroides CCNUC1 TaxID=2653204 RepID=A0A5P8WFD1_9NOSO|nr:hypothetical protein [Nostoc sphaeroides]QFS51535.1 hypothetical protein GXM_09029 [Nostoc sphaeroides CCNUC1]